MLWVNFLHFYQPPHQNPALVKKIAKESYIWIYRILKRNERIKCTVNFSGCLLDMLAKNGEEDIIKKYKELAQRGQIEFTATAKYHPILPLITEKEVLRQITLNNTVSQSYFGAAYHPEVFFPPEMAYAPFLAPLLESLGYNGILLDEIAFQGKLGGNILHAYPIDNTHLLAVFRNRAVSKSYVPETLEKEFAKENSLDTTYLTATDAEMYGHRHEDRSKSFEKIAQDKSIQTMTVSQWMKQHHASSLCHPLASSWETTEADMSEGNPYPLWNDPKNSLHALLWKLASLGMELNEQYNAEGKDRWARRHLDQGLASCTWWWASNRKPDAFAPITWNPEDIEKGTENLIKSVRSLSSAPQEKKIEAEDIATDIQDLIWKTHWKR